MAAKVRYWGKATVSFIFFFCVWLTNAMVAYETGTSAATGVVSLLWLFVTTYAVTGNAQKIVTICKLALSIQALGAIIVSAFFPNPEEYLLSLAIPTIVWLIMYFWASSSAAAEVQSLNNHAPSQKDEIDIGTLKSRLIAAERVVFDAYNIPQTPPAPTGLSLGVVPGIERSVRFRFAVACVVAKYAETATGKQAVPFIEMLFEAVTDSLEGYSIRVSGVFPASAPIPKLDFSYAYFQRESTNLADAEITNARGLMQELSAVYYRDMLDWLTPDRMTHGGSSLLIRALTTGDTLQGANSDMGVMQLLTHFVGSDREFETSLDAIKKSAPTDRATAPIKDRSVSDRNRKAPQTAALDAPNNGVKQSKETIDRKSKYRRALLAIEYDQAVERAWRQLNWLPDAYQEKFLSALDSDPTCDPTTLAKELCKEHEKVKHPYDREDLNAALDDARSISEEAAEEFKAVVDLLGDKIDPATTIDKIEAKFGPTAKSLAAKAAAERAKKERLKAAMLREVQEEERRREIRLAKSQRQSKNEKWVIFSIGIFILFVFYLLAR